MTGRKRTALFFLLLALPVFLAPAQTSSTTSSETFVPETAPQWVKDLRRWEIVTFGSFPFTMFMATFAMDMYRWSQANGMDFSDEGRRYAPWPLKSAGAIAMESKEQELTIMMAAGLSVVVALADLIIVQIKRSKARKRAEALPSGTTIITRTPLLDDSPEAQDDAVQGTLQGAGQGVMQGAALGAIGKETIVPDQAPEMP
ncbi:MAG: hypothetical protein LBQ69_06475 [Treponema sp.]|nr:hypothetical protein [Treponema sp.]